MFVQDSPVEYEGKKVERVKREYNKTGTVRNFVSLSLSSFSTLVSLRTHELDV